MDDDKQRRELLQQVASENDADLFLFSGPVVPRAERTLNAVLRVKQTKPNAMMLTTTYGGSADVAYQLVRSVRRHYPDGRFILFVDSLCKSAGTLIALGADSIVMSDTAELGPLDVQVLRPGEMGEFMSGLTPSQALETLQGALFEAFETYFFSLRSHTQGQISTRTAADLAVQLVVGVYGPIYQQIDPMRLAENERYVAIARAYGGRIKTGNVKSEAIDQLVKGYPSHGFVVDRDEAKRLFNNVRGPTENELRLAKEFRAISEQALTADAPVITRLEFGGKKSGGTESNDIDDNQANSGSADKEAAHTTDSSPAQSIGSEGDDATKDGGS